MDGVDKGFFFEKLIIYYFTQGKQNNYEFNFFNEFTIDKI